MIFKISLVLAITLLLMVSHFMAAVLGFAVFKKEEERAKQKAVTAWLCLFVAVPFAIALLLITAVAA